MEKEKYSEELNVAVRVVHMACSLCQKVKRVFLVKHLVMMMRLSLRMLILLLLLQKQDPSCL